MAFVRVYGRGTPDRAGARPYHGVGGDLHGILMLTRMLAAAGRDFCGLATRFAVAWAFGALWFDFLVSNSRQQPLTAKR
jgi:hypothetical protein